MQPAVLHKIQSSMRDTPIQKAWLFGSQAREEERETSDIDILVQFVPNANISLFDYGGIIYQLEQAAGQRIDLVQEKGLKAFAKQNVEKDKILIYERKIS